MWWWRQSPSRFSLQGHDTSTETTNHAHIPYRHTKHTQAQAGGMAKEDCQSERTDGISRHDGTERDAYARSRQHPRQCSAHHANARANHETSSHSLLKTPGHARGNQRQDSSGETRRHHDKAQQANGTMTARKHAEQRTTRPNGHGKDRHGTGDRIGHNGQDGTPTRKGGTT